MNRSVAEKLNEEYTFNCPSCDQGMLLREGTACLLEWVCTNTECGYHRLDADPEEIAFFRELCRQYPSEAHVTSTPAPRKKKPGLKAGTVGTGKVLKDAATAAATAAIAAKLAEGMVELARHHAGEYWPPFLDTPAGRKLAQAAIPVALIFLCQTMGDALPAQPKVERAATLAINAIAASGTTEIIDAFGPFLQNLVALSDGVPIRKLLKT